MAGSPVFPTSIPNTLQNPSPRRVKSSQLAWLVIGLSFLVFCILCALTLYGVNYFLFDSTVPIQAELTVARGTAGLTGTDLIEQVVRGQRTLDNRWVITTDGQSQATLAIADPYANGRLVATVTINGDTAFDLSEVSRPRFEWSGLDYQINLSEIKGALDIEIPETGDREVQVRLSTPAGDLIYLNGVGTYEVNITPGVMRVVNEAETGRAVIVSNDGLKIEPVAAGERGLYYPALGQFAPIPASVDLLGGAPLDSRIVFSSDGTASQVQDGSWRCQSSANDGLLGAFDFATIDGREALRITRTNSDQHGDTRCAMALRGDATDVTGYNTLTLHAEFKIVSQSISACGVDGSECPLMLRVDYQPEGGGTATQFWVHGFFTVVPQLGDRPNCDNCTEPHEFVNQGAWYSYTSANLFTLFPANQYPARIVNVTFYASGHEYDVYVGQLALYAGQDDPPAPVGVSASG